MTAHSTEQGQLKLRQLPRTLARLSFHSILSHWIPYGFLAHPCSHRPAQHEQAGGGNPTSGYSHNDACPCQAQRGHLSRQQRYDHKQRDGNSSNAETECALPAQVSPVETAMKQAEHNRAANNEPKRQWSLCG